jgi:hypothetical protein
MKVFRRPSFWAAAALSAALSGVAIAASPNHSGFYKHLVHIEEADDYVGAQIQVMDGPKPRVRFELCEGWCNGAHVFPARIDGDRINFVLVENLTDSEGRKSVSQMPVSGRFTKRGLVLRVNGGPPELLRPIKKSPW